MPILGLAMTSQVDLQGGIGMMAAVLEDVHDS